jgi:hypothetical protein
MVVVAGNGVDGVHVFAVRDTSEDELRCLSAGGNRVEIGKTST